MKSESQRAYRKSLITNGLVYINDEEQEVSVINISLTGALVQLNSPENPESLIDDASASKIIDFYLPKLRLAGTAEVVRVSGSRRDDSLALKFKEISYNVDNLYYKRKVYRKNMAVAGKILLNNKQYDFQAINVSVEGLMIRLAETIIIAQGISTAFEFKSLNLKGEAQVVWMDIDSEGKTLVGLKYINMNTDKITGIPRFAC
ncbi:MAG: PilZ domain-containing protein [Methylococcales bacterium]|nr:PilZ domain-containing protein [Methylococcales bacterium]MDP3840897.1 PilZ domain-containing protein [Methylococcales bacterium]